MSFRSLLALFVSLCVPAAMFATPAVALQKGSVLATPHAQTAAARPSRHLHRVVIQVNDSDPKVMNLALNNAENVSEYYKSKGAKINIQIVAFGPGLHMLRADSSPVKDRIARMSLALPELEFSACATTQSKMAQAEHKDIPLISEARVVPSGVVRIMELQENGYSYIRP